MEKIVLTIVSCVQFIQVGNISGILTDNFKKSLYMANRVLWFWYFCKSILTFWHFNTLRSSIKVPGSATRNDVDRESVQKKSLGFWMGRDLMLGIAKSC